MSNPSKRILYLGKTIFGHQHDYAVFKQEFDPSLPWFDKQTLWVDLGYQGLEKDYQPAHLLIPLKKTATSSESVKELKKALNKRIAQLRMPIEHAIGGMKNYRIITQPIRLKALALIDKIIETCAGLWNYKLDVNTLLNPLSETIA
jgi:hypothetical protein